MRLRVLFATLALALVLMQGLEGDGFSVGVASLATKFKVDRPPHQVDGVWKMTVDGVELTRTAE